MVAQVTSFTFHGVEARQVYAQVQLTGGTNGFTIVGLPDKAVSEARERVRAALCAVGLGLPPKRITVNLSPADLPKEGSHFDLPIALALLMEIGALPRDMLDSFAVIGELGLDGSISPVHGALPAAVAANTLDLGLVCPAACGGEAAWAGSSAEILAPATLIQLVNHFKGTQVLSAPEPGGLAPSTALPEMADVRGQESAKRALEVAAAGGHNLLMVGPPGAGKSMMAARLPALLPPLTPAEMLEVSMVQSMAGLLDNGKLTRERPFRAPHHSASMAAMVGGGIKAKPGEASLAHHGVLFLDELPEFSATVLDSLRQPLETGDVLIARANFHVRYPARFQLIAAMNPCKCGYGRASGRACGRGPNCEQVYQSRISGPFLDRMDLAVTLPAVSPHDLGGPATGETSQIIAARVARAREIQLERNLEKHVLQPEQELQNNDYKSLAALSDANLRDLGSARTGVTNTALSDSLLMRFAKPDQEGAELLGRAVDALSLSARGYHRILRVARTFADLDGGGGVKRRHIAEAVSYRLNTGQLASSQSAPKKEQVGSSPASPIF